MRISAVIMFYLLLGDKLIAQSHDISAICTDLNGTQSSMLFKNEGASFCLNENEIYRIQKDENGVLHSKLSVSGDFDGDGVQESALFYDYNYYPNGTNKFTGSKIVVYGQRNKFIIPIGIWFSKLKTDFSFEHVSFSTSGDYNSDGKADIALFSNVATSDVQAILVLFSNGVSFDEPKVFFSTIRDEFNFNALKYALSGDFTGDDKSDIAVFYDYFGDAPDTKQKIFVFESSGTCFTLSSPLFTTTKSEFDFDTCVAALAGDYNGDNKIDIAYLINDAVADKQSIEVFENSNKTCFLKKTYLSPERNDVNFSRIKLAASGLITSDKKADIVICYDHIGFDTQLMLVFESTGAGFATFKNFFSTPKSAFSFDQVNALFVGKYDAKPKVTPTIWYNNKRAAVTFGFDDGMTNALRYGARELSKNKLNGTFYVISNVPFNNEPDYCNWDTLSHYQKLGHEIGSHSANHRFLGSYTGHDSIAILNALFDKSKKDFDTQLKQNTISLSYPFGSFNPQTPTLVATYFLNARSSQWGYNLPTPFDFHALKSLYISSVTTNETIKSWFHVASIYNYHISLMYHNIQNIPFDKESNEYSFALCDLTQNIDDAKQAGLWIETQGNVYKYTYERNAMKLLSYDVCADSIQFVVDDFLDNSLFNQPLTLRVEIPESWSQDSVFTNQSDKKTAVFSENEYKYCYLNTIPNNSKITVSKFKVNTVNGVGAIRSEQYLRCFRSDSEHITVGSLPGSSSKFHLKIFNSSGVILVEKNMFLNSNFEIELPLSYQFKYIVIQDNLNRIVTRKILF